MLTNIFVKNDYVFLSKKDATNYAFLQVFLMSGLWEDGWNLLSASTFILLRYAVQVEVCEVNSASCRCLVVKERVLK